MPRPMPPRHDGKGSSMGFGRLKRGLNEDLAKDPSGIAYVGSPVGPNLPPELKLLELAETSAGPYYAYTLENLARAALSAV